MSAAGDTHGPFSLNLLLFSVAGVTFGVDAEQVEDIFPCRGEVSEDLCWFQRELGHGDAPPLYEAPVVLAVRGRDETDSWVLIDRLEDVTGIAAGDIRPFPPLVEPFALRKGLWGIVVKGDRMVLLVDFQRLLRERRDVNAHLEVTSNDDI